MFSGIVEATSIIQSASPFPGGLRISIDKPKNFNDIELGDSIAINGICLTVEAISEKITFALGPETLRVTGWGSENVMGKVVNLERSLKVGDRMHGHMVTGHIDAMGIVVQSHPQGEGLIQLTVQCPPMLAPLTWPKGSIAINGVSLTINQVSTNTITVGLIPETLKKTNLKYIQEGDPVTLEVDNMARGWLRQKELNL